MTAGVHWILGLPFDLLRPPSAAERLRAAADNAESVVFATPNLNFLRTASGNRAFRDQILRTDLSLVDGMPVLWLGRAVGVPVPERVPGSGLVDRLALPDERRQPLRTFIFGAEGDAAQRAVAALNSRDGGLVGAGALNPGHGSLEAMSTPEIIDRINAARADVLIVSLGAVKGHAWIEHNRERLEVGLISHLGAAVNFLAGTVRRAPPLMQKLGLEWFWRTLTEPRLAGRYLGDAGFLLREIVTAVVPLAWVRLRMKGRSTKLTVRRTPGRRGSLELSGALTEASVAELAGGVARLREDGVATDIELNVDELDYVDARGLGFLYELMYRHDGPGGVRVIGGNRRLRRLLRWHRAECLVQPGEARTTAAEGREADLPAASCVKRPD